MAQLFANNAYSVLNGGINDITTSIAVSTGTGSRFPSPSGGDYFLVTLAGIDVNGNENAWEILKCTARVDDVLTVERAQEGTVAASWDSGTRIELRVTAAQAGAFESAYGWGNHSGLYLPLTGTGNKSVTGVPYIPETTLTGSTTITWNFATANVEAVVTLGGNRTLAMSNVPPAGTWATLRVVQGSSTPRTLAFGTGIDAGDAGTPIYSSGAGKEDLLSFRSNGIVMQCVGQVGGYA
jgi:hypothetical protein